MFNKITCTLLVSVIYISLSSVCIAQLDDNYDDSNLEESGILNSTFTGNEINTNEDPNPTDIFKEDLKKDINQDNTGIQDDIEAEE